MEIFLEQLNNFFGDHYFVFFENENVEGSGPWMVSDIFFGFTYLKLIDSTLKYSKDAVLKEYENNIDEDNLNEILNQMAIYPSGETVGFYNTSKYDLGKICNEKNYFNRLQDYIDCFSENVKEVFDEMDFSSVLEFLEKSEMTLPVLKTFNEATIDEKHFSSYDNFILIFQEFIKSMWHDEIYSIGRDPITNCNPLTSYHYIHQTIAKYGSFLISLLLSGMDFKNDNVIKIYDPDSSGTYILNDVKEMIEMFKRISGHKFDNVELYGKSKRVENRAIYLAKKVVSKKDPYEIPGATILGSDESIFTVDDINTYGDFNLIISNYLYNDLFEYNDIFEIFKRKSDYNTKLTMALNNLDDFIDDLKDISRNDNLEALISFKNHYIIIANLNKAESRKGYFLLIDESDTNINDEEIDRQNQESFSNNNFDPFSMILIKPLSDRDHQKMNEILNSYQKFCNSPNSRLIKNDDYDSEMIRLLIN